MPVHLSKVAFGCAKLETLGRRVESRAKNGIVPVLTRFRPKRADELVGGSLYWIIKHRLVARQAIVGFGVSRDRRTVIQLDPTLVPVHSLPKRAHQGWRYLDDADTPRDLGADIEDSDDLPPEMAVELAELGLI